MKSIRLEAPNTEFMKIRQYVVELIIRGGNEPQKVPSTRKLAQMFGVSHPTALKVLRNLAESGHLIACGNSGYITVPGSFSCWGKLKIIGVVMGDGCNVLFSRQYVAESSPVLEAILGRSGSLSAQYIYLQGTPENAVTIIRNYNLDGLIWFSPDPKYGETIRILRESGLPIVEVGFVTGNASCARWNFVEDHYRIMNQILKEGRRHPLILSTNCPQDLYSAILAGFRRSCEENNFPLEQSIFVNGDPDSVMRQVSQLLNYGLSFDDGKLLLVLGLPERSLRCEKQMPGFRWRAGSVFGHEVYGMRGPAEDEGGGSDSGGELFPSDGVSVRRAGQCDGY